MKDGWKMVKLGEVCEINLGKTPPRGEDRMWDKKMLTQNIWLSIADLKNTCNGYIYDSKEYISDVASELIPIVKEGTLMMSFKLSIGKCAIAGKDLRTNEAIAALPFKTNNVNINYLKYYLEGFDWATFASGDEKVLGTTLNKKKLNIVPIILPPLSEQTRIVSLLDDAFGKLERSREKALKLLDDAKEIFQAQLKKEMTPKEGWEVKKIGDVGKVTTGQTPSTSHKEYFGGNIPFIKPADINIDGCGNINLQNEGLTEEGCSNSRSIEGDSVLMVCIGATIGKTGYVQNSKIAFNQQINAISEVKDCDIKFIYYALIGNDFQEQVMNEGKSAQATLPIINKKKWANLEIPLPPLSEQSAIVSRLDVLSSQLKQIEEKTNKYLADLDELKQSLLKKAFEGKI